MFSFVLGRGSAIAIFLLGITFGLHSSFAQNQTEVENRDPFYDGTQSGLFGNLAQSSVFSLLQSGQTKAVREFLLPPSQSGRPQNLATHLDGRFSSRSYFSTDSSTAFDSPNVFISFMETDVRARRVTSLKLDFNLDATFIADFTGANERRFGETESLDQIRQLNIAVPITPRLKLFVGRRLIRESGNAWVDGLDIQYTVLPKQLEVGIYGGLTPDRFDRSLTVDYQAAGGYAYFHRTGLDASIGYNAILYQGAMDRQFLSQRTHYKILEGLFFSDYLILDFVDDPSITTFLGTLDYTPFTELNLALNFSRYSLEQYRNQAIYRNIIEPNQALILGNEVIDLIYNRVRLSASWRLIKHLYHYQMVEYKSRAQDGASSRLYTIGLREENLLRTGIDLALQAQFADHFRADTLILAATARKNISSTLYVDARFTRFNGRTLDQNTDRLRVFDEAQEIYLFGASVIGRLTRNHRISASYDGVYEDELTDLKNEEQGLFIHTGMFKYSYLF